MLNPGLAHHAATDRVLLYLVSTQSLALRQGGGLHLEVASDALFADNSSDRKSLQGYTIRLYGGLIAWKASKQDTVTTSTTEAELLALSQVAKEAIFITRLIRELQVDLPQKTITIHCDNIQTISLVTKETSKLQTKLRHVDIHNHWLRQEVQRGTISVKYIPSASMPADGLTKALPKNKWSAFLNYLNLEERTDRLNYQELSLSRLQGALELVTLQDAAISSSTQSSLDRDPS
jgi:hypothetical protein